MPPPDPAPPAVTVRGRRDTHRQGASVFRLHTSAVRGQAKEDGGAHTFFASGEGSGGSSDQRNLRVRKALSARLRLLPLKTAFSEVIFSAGALMR